VNSRKVETWLFHRIPMSAFFPVYLLISFFFVVFLYFVQGASLACALKPNKIPAASWWQPTYTRVGGGICTPCRQRMLKTFPGLPQIIRLKKKKLSFKVLRPMCVAFVALLVLIPSARAVGGYLKVRRSRTESRVEIIFTRLRFVTH
jgi:hypothetical protein